MYKITVTWMNGLKYSFDIPLSEKQRSSWEAHYSRLPNVKKVTFRKVKIPK